MDVSYMLLNDYEIEGEYQKLEVIAYLVLLETQGESVRKREEKVRVKFVKDKNCKTQAVSGPEILTCKKCGAPISLLEGNTCPYCGDTRHLAKYDWAIAEYEIM